MVAIQRGAFSADDAVERYRLSLEELWSWISAYRDYGPAGLCVTRRRRQAVPA